MKEPQPVRLLKYVSRYGLLHADGYVQLGAGGPYEHSSKCGPLEKATWNQFNDWLTEAPLKIARNPGQRGRMKHLRKATQ